MNSTNKYLLLALLTVLTVSLYAQTDSIAAPVTDSIAVKPKKEHIPMRTMVMINVGISAYKHPSIGFTLARAGQFGYYANFMIGINNLHMGYDYHIAPDGSLMDGEQKGITPFYSGNRAYNRLSATAGAMCRMGIPLYAYIGGGYGYWSETRELFDRQKWVQTAGSLGHSGVVEVGLMGQVGSFTLLAGYNLFIGQQTRMYHEAKVGVGYLFDR